MKSNSKKATKKQGRPKEIPEKGRSEQEGSDYPHEIERQEQQGGSNASFSEQIDVTPPKPHEFPSVGNAKGDFVSKPYGRTTGRMIGSEPGTESI
jgi:hypothetical protein